MPRGHIKTGTFYPCKACGKPVWRTPSDVHKYNRHQTCNKKCMGVMFKASGNPFWNHSQTPEVRAKVSEKLRLMRLQGLIKGTGPKKGVFKQSPEARAKMSEALRIRWRDHRDKMIACLPRGLDHHFAKLPEQLRHRKGFTELQRRELRTDACFYCGSIEELELDHIIPIFDGGFNHDSNAQTLCRHCNVWKTNFVDFPRYYAAKANELGIVSP